jgi:hypothetical protein
MCTSIAIAHRELRVGEPVRPVDLEQAEQQRVDHAPLGIEHEADRVDGRDGRHRPGDDEDHRQPADPDSFVNEEAGQEQRQHELEVDRDQQEKDRIQDRGKEDGVLEQRAIAFRVARQPQP